MADLSLNVVLEPTAVSLDPTGHRTAVTVTLSLTNLSPRELRITTYRSFGLQAVDSAGRSHAAHAISDRSRLIRPSDCPFLPAGGTIRVALEGGVVRRDGDLRLEFDDGAGGMIVLGGLRAGEYRLRFVYRNDHGTIATPGPPPLSLESFWVGELTSPAVPFALRP